MTMTVEKSKYSEKSLSYCHLSTTALGLAWEWAWVSMAQLAIHCLSNSTTTNKWIHPNYI